MGKNLTVFVYGTLMKGFGNERVIADFPHTNERVKVDGVDLFDVGGFPAMVEGENSYYGELVTFDQSVVPEQLYAHMDGLEGYSPNRPEEHCMYLRRPITVTKENGEQVETEYYLWNRSTKSLYHIDPNEFDDYRKYRAAKDAWYADRMRA